MEIIYIHALGCMTCMQMHEKVLALKEETNVPIREYNIDFDEVPFQNLGEYFPVTILLKDQKELKRIVGEWELEEFLDVLRRHKHE